MRTRKGTLSLCYGSSGYQGPEHATLIQIAKGASLGEAEPGQPAVQSRRVWVSPGRSPWVRGSLQSGQQLPTSWFSGAEA